jgi:LysM repeat protein
VSERGLPTLDGAPACPFVAFADDREGRATSPDHRHRCFAETPPAPRAAAHQEAYCLSSAFPVCPTFQDWARREAAHARGAGERPETAPTAVPADDDGPPGPALPTNEVPVHRNPPRDWAAPPPWATGAGAAGAGRAAVAGGTGGAAVDPAADPAAPEFLASRTAEGQGLAGSAADWLAGGPLSPPPVAPSPSIRSDAPAAAAHDELADLVRRPAAPGSSGPGPEAYPPSTRTGRRPAVSSTRPAGDEIPGPSWERMRRYEAYPSIRTRAGIPGLPRLALLAGALVIAAVVLFMLPALLGIGGGGSSSPAPSGSGAAPTASASPTVPPAPTPQVYVIKEGDTLSKVAKRFGVTLDALLAANKDTIKNADKIAVGDTIIIPIPAPEEFTNPSAPAP